MQKVEKRTGAKNLPARAGRFFADLIYPRLCYSCGEAGSYLCKNCFPTSGALPHSVCPVCEARLPGGVLSKICGKQIGLNRIFTCASYRQNTINRLIKDLKYKPARALANPLSEYIAWWLEKEKYTEEITKNVEIIIPVPGHIKKTKKRGFNHAQIIAENLGGFLKIPVECEMLIKTKRTASQVEAGSREKRVKNLIGAFAADKRCQTSVAGGTVLLVDDVVTTASTMRECANVLRAAGAREVWGLAVAKD